MSGVDEGICAHLRGCEEALLDPAVRRDRGRVAALLHEEFTEFGASGRVWTRDGVLELLATEEYVPPVIEDFVCEWIADGVVLVKYRAVKTEAGSGMGSETLRSSLWTKEHGEWRVRFHQGTRAE